MNKGLLIDTSILIYAIDADSIFHEKARELLLNPGKELYTTSKNISEFLVVLTRTESPRIEVMEVLKILKDLLSDFTVLYPIMMEQGSITPCRRSANDRTRGYNPLFYGRDYFLEQKNALKARCKGCGRRWQCQSSRSALCRRLPETERL